MDTSTTKTNSKAQGTSLEQEWDQFNKKLQDTTKAPNAQEIEEFKTPLKIHQDTEPKFQHAKIIPALPTSKIVLKVTKIPPFDVFYSPLHKVVVRRQRKRRSVDALEFSLGDEPMDIV